MRVKVTRISIAEVRLLLAKEEFQSAVGHPGTAQVLSQLTGIEIPVNRISVSLSKGDRAIQLSLGVRLPEGKVLSADELYELIPQMSFYLCECEVEG